MKIIKNFFLWIENKFWNVVIPLMSNSTFVHRIVVTSFRVNKAYSQLNLLMKMMIMAIGGWLIGFLIGAIFIS